jgi:hypothetical protein
MPNLSNTLIRRLSTGLLFALPFAVPFATAQQPAPKVEIFGGYSALYPNATANGLLPGALLPIASCLCWNPRGAGASITYDFNRWIGITADMSGHWGDGATTTAGRLGHYSAYNVSAGPKFTYRTRHFAPFAEVLVGGDRLAPELFHADDAFGFLAGGGIDIPIGRHISLRPAQADFDFSNHSFGPQPLVPATDVRGLRVQAGVVFLFGGAKAKPAAFAPAPLPVTAPIPAPEPAPVEAPAPPPPTPPQPVPPAAAPLPPAPLTNSLSQIEFPGLPAARVDNRAKAVLDGVALTLQHNIDARLALTGESATGEPSRAHLAALRAVDTKEYLVTDKGIDASRIDVYTGNEDTRNVLITLIPLGATLDTTGITPVDETRVLAHPRTPLVKHHK